MDRIRNLVIAFGLGLLTLLSQDATAATRYVSSDRYSSSFSYRSDQSNRLSSFQSNTRSYYTPYKSGGFRKSDYIMPVGILQRMGGVSTLKKERLLLAGSVYVGSRMRHKFSSTGDGNGYSYLNTYDDIAVCESPSFKAPVNKDLSTRPSVGKNYSYFVCPTDAIGWDYDEDSKYCCGKEKQRCCDEEEFYRYHGDAAVFGPVLAVLLVSIILCCCCCCGAGFGIYLYISRQNQRNRNVPQPNAVAHPPMQMAGPPVPYAPVPGSAVATNLPTAAYPRQPMGHDPAVPASAPPADAGFSGYPALQAPPPAYSPPEDKSYQ
ncbi:hypothetical protein BOX15_Mlig029235g2 [Macrostomum lignano]|uniref:CX domain-containing protein n=1 Tax=Macrostomum lignano TaxID=282301 RepID=A0A267GBW9_9PLAT|nr:hypothetical protein BOX15_Mlig029235g2 [Macrostomum lignano]